jgi:hypothetical protein
MKANPDVQRFLRGLTAGVAVGSVVAAVIVAIAARLRPVRREG